MSSRRIEKASRGLRPLVPILARDVLPAYAGQAAVSRSGRATLLCSDTLTRLHTLLGALLRCHALLPSCSLAPHVPALSCSRCPALPLPLQLQVLVRLRFPSRALRLALSLLCSPPW
ncbi:hypothetical protein FKP32DRAFT_1586580 [Trametes sanguinea]|nr:hypothetical protein FKP32DRAFT_1589190 [Trametes sanguinea]KAI9069857.1 hypothetical protein FKP32DRAFT_1586580 [Trametes sanguinea]